jgi:phosphoribosyl 1,2-cyclic phosphodiesterase
MPLRYCVLASGSSGNCLWVAGGGVEILVDCGISARATARKLESVGRDLGRVSAVICTHCHGDHVAAAPMLTRRHGIDLWGTPATLRQLPAKPAPERLRPMASGSEIRLGGLTIRSVPTPHDAPESVALVVTDGEHSLGVVTDLGTPTPGILAALEGVDALHLEMNHDPKMLEDGPYPFWLKKRIRGDFGHLSNQQGAELLQRLAHPGLQHVTLAHLSEENNSPDLARAAAERALERTSFSPQLTIAQPYEPGRPIELGAKRGQLALPLR